VALCGAHVVEDNEERKYMNPSYELFMYSEFIVGLLKKWWLVSEARTQNGSFSFNIHGLLSKRIWSLKTSYKSTLY